MHLNKIWLDQGKIEIKLSTQVYLYITAVNRMKQSNSMTLMHLIIGLHWDIGNWKNANTLDLRIFCLHSFLMVTHWHHVYINFWIFCLHSFLMVIHWHHVYQFQDDVYSIVFIVALLAQKKKKKPQHLVMPCRVSF